MPVVGKERDTGVVVARQKSLKLSHHTAAGAGTLLKRGCARIAVTTNTGLIKRGRGPDMGQSSGVQFSSLSARGVEALLEVLQKSLHLCYGSCPGKLTL